MEGAWLLAAIVLLLWKVVVPFGVKEFFADLSVTGAFCTCSAFDCPGSPLLSISPIPCGKDKWKVGLQEKDCGRMEAWCSR